MEFIRTVMLDMKTAEVAEVVSANSDGSFTIFINSRLSKDRQEEAYIHALSHIINDDFEAELSADEIEAMRHRKEG